MAGYSKRSIVEKLGIKAGQTIVILNAPQGYEETLGRLPENVTIKTDIKRAEDFIQFFTKSREELEVLFPKLKAKLNNSGMLWISWPKASSKHETDLNENIVMQIGLANGLVDIKVIAVDDVWSGLKFVYRLKDRK